MTIDKYTKILLTVIAVGIIGINIHFYKISPVKEAKAAVELIDLMFMQDKIIERIALSETTINSGIQKLKREQRVQFYLAIGMARELGVSEEKLLEVLQNSARAADYK